MGKGKEELLPEVTKSTTDKEEKVENKADSPAPTPNATAPVKKENQPTPEDKALSPIEQLAKLLQTAAEDLNTLGKMAIPKFGSNAPEGDAKQSLGPQPDTAKNPKDMGVEMQELQSKQTAPTPTPSSTSEEKIDPEAVAKVIKP